MAFMQGVLLNECVPMAFYSFRIVTVRSYQMRILVKLDLSYVLLHSKFQLSVTLLKKELCRTVPDSRTFFEFSSFSGTQKKVLLSGTAPFFLQSTLNYRVITIRRSKMSECVTRQQAVLKHF